MISMHKWYQVKILREQGVSIKKIARQLKLSKNTVRKYLRLKFDSRRGQRELKQASSV
ncbi:MAG: HTH domain-containing protein [Nitrospirae bacterium]|nr:MAG: HTH domain-containing protein [Nitrospirota bacterium]